MEKTDLLYQQYLDILKKELVAATGCTEPIAISYAAAKARDTLGATPDKILIEASGNIIKNVKSVVVPNTDGLKGLKAAAAAGIVAGDAEKELECIDTVSAEQKKEIRDMLDSDIMTVKMADSDMVFDIILTLYSGEDYVKIRIVDEHTNVVHIDKNGEIILDIPVEEDYLKAEEDFLTVDGIIDFANTCDLEDVRETIQRQIEYNTAIAEEGLKNPWGARVGKTLIDHYDAQDVRVRAKAMAAAGSDARMSGCEMPVVVNSGSGNQGLAVSLPVIEYAKELKSSEEDLYRALVLANLLGIHQKFGIGRLSAYCGAVSAGCAAGAGIAYLQTKNPRLIKHTLVNSLATASGIICDGAKPSCAAKIAMAVDAGILGLILAQENNQFRDGEGIVKKGVENTIDSVGHLGKIGMRETDKEILRIMIDEIGE